MILDDLKATADAVVATMNAANAYLGGVQAKIAKAVADALAGGATKDQLAGVQAVIDELGQSKGAQDAAVAAAPQ